MLESCTSVAQKTSLLCPPTEGSKNPGYLGTVFSHDNNLNGFFCFRKAKSYFSLFCGAVPLKPDLSVETVFINPSFQL